MPDGPSGAKSRAGIPRSIEEKSELGLSEIRLRETQRPLSRQATIVRSRLPRAGGVLPKPVFGQHALEVRNPQPRSLLLPEELSYLVELSGTAQFLVLVGDEPGVFVHEDFAGFSQIEVLRIVAEAFAMNATPDQAAVGVDVDLGDAEFGGPGELVLVNTLCAFQLPATSS